VNKIFSPIIAIVKKKGLEEKKYQIKLTCKSNKNEDNKILMQQNKK
jgi:hypothetical protein